MQHTSTEFPTISYIWVGAPKKDNSQDIAGVIKMAERNHSNPLHFWCLKEHVDHYRQQLGPHKIIVHSIEDELASLIKDPNIALPTDVKDNASLDEQAAILLHIWKTLHSEKFISDNDKLLQTQRNVEFKDLFSSFLVNYFGGYIIDTNITPLASTTEFKLSRPTNDSLHMPFIFKNVNKDEPECFMLYSPKGDVKAQQLHLIHVNECLALLKMHDDIISSNKSYAHPEDHFHKLFCKTFKTAITTTRPNKFEGATTSNGRIRFHDLDLEKEYHSSHVRTEKSTPTISTSAHGIVGSNRPKKKKPDENSDSVTNSLNHK